MPSWISRRVLAASPHSAGAGTGWTLLFVAASSGLACSLLAPSDEELTGGIESGGGGSSVAGAGGGGGSGAGVAGSAGNVGSAGSSETIGTYPVLPVGGSGGSAGSAGTPPPLDAPDAGMVSEPAPCVDCETIRITGGVSTVEFGSPGGSLFMDICPRDQVVVGMDYRFNFFAMPPDLGFLTSVSLVCAEVVPNRSTGTVDVILGEPLTPRGAGSGVAGSGGRCPLGQVVTGFEGARNFDGATSEILELTLHCAPLALADDGSVVLGDAQPTQPMSAGFAVSTVLPSEVLPLQPCPQGQLARGAALRGGSWVDSVGLICSAPVLSLPDAEACSSDIECQSGLCEGTCQPRACTPPAGCRCGLLESTQYAFCEAAQTRADAAASCAEVGMHLADARDPIAHGWLRSSAGKEGIQAAFWLGADDLALEGDWQWAELGPVDLASELWETNEARGGSAENCMTMTRNGHWDDADCALALPFVCEAPTP